MPVTLPGPGTLVLTGKGVVKQTYSPKAAGIVKALVKAKGKKAESAPRHRQGATQGEDHVHTHRRLGQGQDQARDLEEAPRLTAQTCAAPGLAVVSRRPRNLRPRNDEQPELLAQFRLSGMP